MILPASTLTSIKYKRKKLALNYDTDDEMEKYENGYNSSDCDKAIETAKRMMIWIMVWKIEI